MTSDSIWQLQKSVYNTLNNDSTLTAMVSGIFDYVKEDTAFPYIVLGDVKSSDLSTKTTNGTQIDLTIEAYCRDRGSKTCLEIMSRINELLHNANLTLVNHNLIYIRFDSSEVVQQQDGLTYRGTALFRAITEEI